MDRDVSVERRFGDGGKKCRYIYEYPHHLADEHLLLSSQIVPQTFVKLPPSLLPRSIFRFPIA